MTKPVENHRPYMARLLAKKKDYNRIEKEVLDAIEDGLPVKDAFLYAGVDNHRYYNWLRHYKEDITHGVEDTPLVKLFNKVYKQDKALFRKISRVMLDKAEEGDVRMLQYLGDNRFGYANKRRNNIELGTAPDNNVQINIIDMKRVDEIEERSKEEDIVVNGVCRDDSNSNEMD